MIPTNNFKFLPDNFNIDREGHLFYKEQRVANGYVKVLDHLITVKSHGQEVISVKLAVVINSKESISTYTMEKINETQFFN